MKKKIFFLAFAKNNCVRNERATLSSQIRKCTHRHSKAFNVKPKEKAIGDIGISNIFTVDSLATLNLLGSSQNKSGAYITFGNEKFVGIGEFSSTKLQCRHRHSQSLWGKGYTICRRD